MVGRSKGSGHAAGLQQQAALLDLFSSSHDVAAWGSIAVAHKVAIGTLVQHAQEQMSSEARSEQFLQSPLVAKITAAARHGLQLVLSRDAALLAVPEPALGALGAVLYALGCLTQACCMAMQSTTPRGPSSKAQQLMQQLQQDLLPAYGTVCSALSVELKQQQGSTAAAGDDSQASPLLSDLVVSLLRLGKNFLLWSVDESTCKAAAAGGVQGLAATLFPFAALAVAVLHNWQRFAACSSLAELGATPAGSRGRYTAAHYALLAGSPALLKILGDSGAQFGAARSDEVLLRHSSVQSLVCLNVALQVHVVHHASRGNSAAGLFEPQAAATATRQSSSRSSTRSKAGSSDSLSGSSGNSSSSKSARNKPRSSAAAAKQQQQFAVPPSHEQLYAALDCPGIGVLADDFIPSMSREGMIANTDKSRMMVCMTAMRMLERMIASVRVQQQSSSSSAAMQQQLLLQQQMPLLHVLWELLLLQPQHDLLLASLSAMLQLMALPSAVGILRNEQQPGWPAAQPGGVAHDPTTQDQLAHCGGTLVQQLLWHLLPLMKRTLASGSSSLGVRPGMLSDRQPLPGVEVGSALMLCELAEGGWTWSAGTNPVLAAFCQQPLLSSTALEAGLRCMLRTPAPQGTARSSYYNSAYFDSVAATVRTVQEFAANLVTSKPDGAAEGATGASPLPVESLATLLLTCLKFMHCYGEPEARVLPQCLCIAQAAAHLSSHLAQQLSSSSSSATTTTTSSSSSSSSLAFTVVCGRALELFGRRLLQALDAAGTDAYFNDSMMQKQQQRGTVPEYNLGQVVDWLGAPADPGAAIGGLVSGCTPLLPAGQHPSEEELARADQLGAAFKSSLATSASVRSMLGECESLVALLAQQLEQLMLQHSLDEAPAPSDGESAPAVLFMGLDLQQLMQQAGEVQQALQTAQPLMMPLLGALLGGVSLPVAAALRIVASHLQRLGAAVSDLPLVCCCCNPCCTAFGADSEAQLVREKYCSACRAAKYCSKQCSVAAWKRHKVVCTRIRQQGQQ